MLPVAGQTVPLQKSRPRTRGDAPCGRYALAGGVTSAPHPRGCSQDGQDGGEQLGVGPAPAGMLHARSAPCSATPGRPRTRGDAPLRCSTRTIKYQSAPHPRGGSQARGLTTHSGSVGPAPAGMLPGAGRRAQVQRCRPRTAGMLPALRPAPVRRSGRPRTRGDVSQLGLCRRLGVASAPRPRGCSQFRNGRAAPCRVGLRGPPRHPHAPYRPSLARRTMALPAHPPVQAEGRQLTPIVWSASAATGLWVGVESDVRLVMRRPAAHRAGSLAV